MKKMAYELQLNQVIYLSISYSGRFQANSGNFNAVSGVFTMWWCIFKDHLRESQNPASRCLLGYSSTKTVSGKFLIISVSWQKQVPGSHEIQFNARVWERQFQETSSRYISGSSNMQLQEPLKKSYRQISNYGKVHLKVQGFNVREIS